MRADSETSPSGEPEPQPYRELSDQERARALARITNRWRERYMDDNGANKSAAFRATGLGSRNTIDRVLNADLSSGKPKPETLQAMASAWNGDYNEAARIMGWSRDSSGQPARFTEPEPPASREVRRVLALLKAPNELVSKARKRRVIDKLDSIWREDAVEARRTGQHVLSDVEPLVGDWTSEVDDLDETTG